MGLYMFDLKQKDDHLSCSLLKQNSLRRLLE